ncbi:hypothetical protein WS81_14220 [Burkholderia sp. MSMB2040]|nr:hypothetical protein WS81_14220 [Burkholderia sp. MSMB2040]
MLEARCAHSQFIAPRMTNRSAAIVSFRRRSTASLHETLHRYVARRVPRRPRRTASHRRDHDLASASTNAGPVTPLPAQRPLSAELEASS